MATLTAPPIPDDFIYVLAGYPQALFAAAASGLFLSNDGGQSWSLATASLGLSEAVPATSLALSPDFVHDHTLFGGMAGGILRSVDGGQGWTLATTPPPPPTVTALAISPNYLEDGVLLAGTMEDGILRSSDRGHRWVPWNFGLLDLSIFSLAISPAFATDDTLFAGAETGIFRSTNGGRAWREVDLPGGFQTVLSLVVSPYFAEDGLLYAGTEERGLLVSHDQGARWEELPSEALEGPVNGLLMAAARPGQEELVALCNGAAVHSADGGQSWSALWPALSAEREITTLYAPQGFGAGAPAWVGLVGGEVIRQTF